MDQDKHKKLIKYIEKGKQLEEKMLERSSYLVNSTIFGLLSILIIIFTSQYNSNHISQELSHSWIEYWPYGVSLLFLCLSLYNVYLYAEPFRKWVKELKYGED